MIPDIAERGEGTATAADPRPAGAKQRQTRASGRALERMVSMADRYLLQQAVEIYRRLIERDGDSPAAGYARQRLLEIADHYEHTGEFHQARGIYERLL